LRDKIKNSGENIPALAGRIKELRNVLSNEKLTVPEENKLIKEIDSLEKS
jgi:uncharacterized coiled-coil DUF342 family protein